jgi:hypothetical protein
MSKGAASKVVSLLGKSVEGPILTVSQLEEKHPALKGRLRGYILRADLGFSLYAGLADAVIRVGRSVMVDEAAALRWLETRKHQPRSRGRNPHGRAGKHARK